MTDTIPEQVLTVLSTAEIDNHNVRITAQLDRKLYLAVNKVLDRIGGKWDRRTKAHVFDVDPTDRLEVVINSGVLDPKIKTGYFPTPAVIVDRMIELADISIQDWMLEPSAGQGHIVDKICEFTGAAKNTMFVCEVLPENIRILEEKGYCVRGDFIEFAHQHGDISGWAFDRIVMNPPFERQADIDHVTAAYNLLAPDGILVTIMSAGVLFRENKKTQEFRDKIMEPHGTYLDRLPAGAFKESGTMVNTILLRLEK
ncbi:MAG: class I SAM-dependent methyltransferase [Planctomycetes bacterium]|nr:class I SAM-dependent methyltransferase [Planctomycetota bacterium]